MARLDRRNRPGERSNQDLRTLTKLEVLEGAILPQSKNVLDREQFIPLNRAVQRLGFQRIGSSAVSQLKNRYMNQGGVSALFGRRKKISSEPHVYPPPVVIHIEAISGSLIHIIYDQDLDTSKFPHGVAFTVSSKTIFSVSYNQPNKIVINVGVDTILPGENDLTITYDKDEPLSPGSAPTTSLLGVEAASFSNLHIINNLL